VTARFAVAGVIMLLAGILTAVLAFVEAASVSVCLDLLALWATQELLRPARRRPSGRTGINRSDPGPRQSGYRGGQPLQG
jgi:hypothetical protein